MPSILFSNKMAVKCLAEYWLSVFSKQFEPRGLHNDGLSSIYFRLPVKAGEIELTVKMKDHLQQTTYPYQLDHKLVLKPAQVLVIDFDSQAGEFIIM